MKILALETSTLLGSVSIVETGRVLAERSSMRQNSHSEIINTYVHECLAEAKLSLENIDCFVAGIGPGSFTGIRVALNAGKSFSYIFQKPIIGIDSLYALAKQSQEFADEKPLPVLALINAYKNMVYFGLFDISSDEPKYLQGPGVLPVQQIKSLLQQKSVVVGDGYDAYKAFFSTEVLDLMVRKNENPDFPHATTLALLAEKPIFQKQTLDWKSLVPLYIRASEAEENKRGIVFIPL